jgi:Ca2+-binding EF-hand superfamily protein
MCKRLPALSLQPHLVRFPTAQGSKSLSPALSCSCKKIEFLNKDMACLSEAMRGHQQPWHDTTVFGAQGRVGEEAFMTRARRVFDSYDARGHGCLTRQEFKLAWMALLGCKPSRCELADVLAPGEELMRRVRGAVGGCAAEEDHASAEQSVGWAQFAHAAARRRAGTDGSDEVRQAFKAFDRRCAGFITLADVKMAFREVAPHVQARTGMCLHLVHFLGSKNCVHFWSTTSLIVSKEHS